MRKGCPRARLARERHLRLELTGLRAFPRSKPPTSGPWDAPRPAIPADIPARTRWKAGIGGGSADDLRHTYATLELAAGTHPKIISERMGHASIAITLDRYTHLDISHQQRAAEAVAARLFPSSSATTEPPAAAESGESHA